MKFASMSPDSQDRRRFIETYVQRLYDRDDGQNSNGDLVSVWPLESITGIPDLAAHPHQGLVVRASHSLQHATRRWSDILAAASRSVFVWNRTLADDSVSNGFDPIMYEGYRDILPPRASRLEQASPSLSRLNSAEAIWRADLVVYYDGTLPTGEIYRSVGHWNPEDEWEVFQVCRGEAAIVAAYRQADRTWNVQVTVCGPGDGCIIKPGGWHLTYALAGNPIIVNLYCCHSPGRESQALSSLSKYATRSHDGPEVVLLRQGTGLHAALLVDQVEQNIPLRLAENHAFFEFIKSSEYKWLGKWFGTSHPHELEQGVAQLFVDQKTIDAKAVKVT